MAGMENAESSILPRPLRVLAGKALQRALNHALSLDPAAAERLQPLEGRAVELHLNGPNLALRVCVEQGALKVEAPSENPNLKVRTTPGVVLAMVLDSHHEVPPGKLDMAGDAGLARQLEGLLKDWKPDFEASFSGLFGDVLGVPMARGMSRTARAARRGFADIREDGAAWVRDEARLTPSKAEVEAYLDGVDQVGERSERLQRRVELLERGQ